MYISVLRKFMLDLSLRKHKLYGADGIWSPYDFEKLVVSRV